MTRKEEIRQCFVKEAYVYVRKCKDLAEIAEKWLGNGIKHPSVTAAHKEAQNQVEHSWRTLKALYRQMEPDTPKSEVARLAMSEVDRIFDT